MPQGTAQLIAQMARARGLDPRAVLAVAAQEGLGGGIGDNGTSFGPFQLHYGGAYPSSAPRGAQASQAWAMSRQGIAYALDQIAKVAGGKHGAAAVQAIVSRFERPANPGKEIQGALGAYGSAPTGGGVAPVAGPGMAAAGQATSPVNAPAGPSRQIVSALLGQIGQKNPDYSALFPLIGAEHSTAPAPTSLPPQPGTPAIPQPAGGPGAALTGQTNGLNTTFEHELSAAARAAGATKVRVDSGVRSPSHNAAVGGVPHSNHITGDAADGAAYVPGKGWVPLGVLLQGVAAKYGLRSGNVPGFYNGGRDPGHVDDGANMRGHR